MNNNGNIQKDSNKKNVGKVVMGAAFLMATSAIGPSGLTQSAIFTQAFMGSLLFVIVIVIILDMSTQLNVWRVICVSGMRGQDLANKILPGLGYFIAVLIVLGGLAFNTGNLSGAALGINVITTLDVRLCAALVGGISICIFLNKNAGPVIDLLTKTLGVLMILVVAYVAIVTKPPVGVAISKLFKPDNPYLLLFPMISLLGLSCGGYVPFSGAHRLLDAGIKGKENLHNIQKSVITGVSVAQLVKLLVFFAIFGVVSTGAILNPQNPAADAFLQGAGVVGYKIFGFVLFAAGITSTIGAAYTSVSFLKTLSKFVEKYEKWFTIGFIIVSALITVMIGKPVTLLVFAGFANGFILPVILFVVLLASHNKKIMGEDYKHPLILTIFGAAVILVTVFGIILSFDSLLTFFI